MLRIALLTQIEITFMFEWQKAIYLLSLPVVCAGVTMEIVFEYYSVWSTFKFGISHLVDSCTFLFWSIDFINRFSIVSWYPGSCCDKILLLKLHKSKTFDIYFFPFDRGYLGSILEARECHKISAFIIVLWNANIKCPCIVKSAMVQFSVVLCSSTVWNFIFLKCSLVQCSAVDCSRVWSSDWRG